MASTRRTRKDISQSQRDMLISLWETKGMRTAKSEHLNEATINTGLSKNQIKISNSGVAGGENFRSKRNKFGKRKQRPSILKVPCHQMKWMET
ncbi:uncharacterized protein LOC143472236 isoform X3 [Clavelina lepadiformis]|uniref:uncharacterized protein LOC143468593 isoform X4 n=1 Tax=Clavelina lepadiformis TaxID=159417 RepID=UPI0040432906